MTDNEAENTPEMSADDTNVVKLPAPPNDYADRPIARFVHEHPVLTVASGLAVGAFAAALIPRRNRQYVAKQSSAFADLISTAGMAFVAQALEKAETAGSDVREQASALADRAGRLGEKAASKAQGLLSRAEPEPEGLVDKVAAKAGEIRERLHR